jgi:HEAT repeat protein
MTSATIVLVLMGLAAAGCATPEIAEDYQEKALLPQEIESALKGDDPAGRADAATQVEKMAAANRKSVLLALVHDERAHVRLLAVSLLSRHHAGDEDAVAALADVLTLDADIDVRVATADALAKGGTHKGLSALLAALTDDTSLVVKRQAAEALDRLTGQTFGKTFVSSIDAAEEAADDAMMSYDGWLEERIGKLVWDAEKCRFVEKAGD